MKIIVAKNYDELSEAAYGVIKEVVLSNPQAVLGLATGSSPLGIYKRMAEECTEGKVSYKEVKTVNLDEYVGLPPTHPQSYRWFMKTNLFDKIDVLPENTHVPNGCAADLAAECKRYDELLEKLPRNVQLLGIGNNGHIAFNEPGSPFDGGTRIVELDKSTIVANARFFESEDEVPKKAISMGIKGIMASEKIVLVASGSNKAEAVRAMCKGPVTEACPASILQNHPDVTVVLDEEAASKLYFKLW